MGTMYPGASGVLQRRLSLLVHHARIRLELEEVFHEVPLVLLGGPMQERIPLAPPGIKVRTAEVASEMEGKLTLWRGKGGALKY